MFNTPKHIIRENLSTKGSKLLTHGSFMFFFQIGDVIFLATQKNMSKKFVPYLSPIHICARQMFLFQLIEVSKISPQKGHGL